MARWSSTCKFINSAFDGYGNTSQRLDTSGNVLETLLASAWGTLQSSNPSSDPFRGWGAQDGVRLDSTGLYCLPDGRYYDAAVGATLSRAPGGGAGGNGYSVFGLNNTPLPTDSLFGLPRNSLFGINNSADPISSSAPDEDIEARNLARIRG